MGALPRSGGSLTTSIGPPLGAGCSVPLQRIGDAVRMGLVGALLREGL